MILVDLSQVMIANLMVQLGSHQNTELDEHTLRLFVLNNIRSIRNKHHGEFGELVICTDSRNSWRRQEFPYYKAARRQARRESELDWETVFTSLGTIQAEIDQYFPYKVISVEGAEADDIIGTICHEEGTLLNSGEKILILSGDKDYIQLHQYGNVKQYAWAQKKWVVHSDPEQYLFQHIASGDRGDGIPNVLSADNCFVIGERQKRLTAKRLEALRNLDEADPQVLRNWERNKRLIDLTCTPENIKQEILAKYRTPKTTGRKHLLNFFIQKRLKLLVEHINDF